MKNKYRTEMSADNRIYDVEEIYNINVTDHVNRDLGKCYRVEILRCRHGEEPGLSYFVLKNKDDVDYCASGTGCSYIDTIFGAPKNTIKFYQKHWI